MNDRAVETDESEDDEKAMVAITKFKGKCHRCGVYGHKGADCRSSGADGGGNGGNGDGGGGGKGRIICHYCKKPEHKVSECRKKKRDQQQGGNNGNGGGSSTEVATLGTKLHHIGNIRSILDPILNSKIVIFPIWNAKLVYFQYRQLAQYGLAIWYFANLVSLLPI